MAIKREVDFLDAMSLGAGAKLGLGASSTTAEQDAVCWFHDIP